MFERLAIGRGKKITNDKLTLIDAPGVGRTAAGWSLSTDSLLLLSAGQK